MAMRLDFEVKLLDETFVRQITEYGYEDVPNGRSNRWGEKPKRMVSKTIEERGGVLIVVKGNPGHSYRITSLEQALDFKLIDHDEYLELQGNPKGLLALRPRLFDLSTGEQVNEFGIPKNIAHELEHGTQLPKRANKLARGNFDTDVDVNTTGDEDIAGNEMPADETGVMVGHEHVAAQIDETE
jgi:hypothetical protein